jgi:hypothetical protein
MRMSDADRERVVERLHTAVGEGRLTLEEFDERVASVLAARTFGEVQPYLADLPVAASLRPPRQYAELRNTASTLKRKGAWEVPRQIKVANKAGTVKLDFTSAIVSHPVVEIDVDVYAGSTILVLPPGATADAEDVEMVAGSLRVRDVPNGPRAGGGPHFMVRGKHRAGSLIIRYQRRFLHWRW